MYDLELRIKGRDWASILLIGVLFGGVLSVMAYWLLERSWIDGLEFGMITGFAITLLSLVFISFMNQRLLPNVRRRYWLPLAVFFSFISGFSGTVVSIVTAQVLGIVLPRLIHDKTWEMAAGAGILTYIMGALLYRFVRMRNEKEEIDRHYTDSRLRSLETQLNPHFLFNALNSLAELVHRDSDKAETAILKLSAFLRSTMNEQARVSVKTELGNVRNYIELENMRFSNRICLEVVGTVPSWHVPKFSVQLLVENAIKHGMRRTQDALHVQIQFADTPAHIIVTNDGVPMERARRGIGLSNLHERLHLLCKGRLEIVQTAPPTIHLYLGECHENTDR